MLIAAGFTTVSPTVATADSLLAPCQVGKYDNDAGGFSVCQGSGYQRVKLSCHGGSTVYGPTVRADGTQSGAWCPIPFLVNIVDVVYFP
ncbi:hypothetical protein [Amycolatopsis decaplanina]|uniref:hypothetical protein n=1 Tax=Amycolatopsis decaplanina TaxID=208441 RepID=UPI0012696F3B|nr:hypothetical protein [Amycolatopsis decaplanina]